MPQTQYNDIYMRDALSDTGQIPSGVRTAYLSPDIIPWKNQTVSNPNSFFTENYGQNVGKNIISNEINYIYARGKNLHLSQESGKIYLYYSRSSFLSQPSEWRDNMISSATPGQDFVNVSAREKDDIVVGDSAFQWDAPQPPTGYHYCLISRVVTGDHPNQIPSNFSATYTFLQWVLDNPGIAWRNVYLLQNDSPPTWQGSVNFMNLDPAQHLYAFTVEARGGFPPETEISMVCSATGPEPPISYADKSEGQDPWYVYTESQLPANFSSGMVITVTLPNGQSWPSGGFINFDYCRIVGGEDHEILQTNAVTPEAYGLPSHIAAKVRGTMIRLGSYSLNVE
jgi:hypothetical protein